MSTDNQQQTTIEPTAITDNLMKYTIESISKIEIDNDNGIYTVTIKWHQVFVKYTFSIDENTFKHINIMKLLKNDYNKIEFIDETGNLLN